MAIFSRIAKFKLQLACFFYYKNSIMFLTLQQAKAMKEKETYISPGKLANRLYIVEKGQPESEIRKRITDQHGNELKGGGIKSYGKIWGSILSYFGIAVKLRVNDQDVYVNTKSFSKWTVRLLSFSKGSKAAPFQSNFKLVHSTYMAANAHGYSSLDYWREVAKQDGMLLPFVTKNKGTLLPSQNEQILFKKSAAEIKAHFSQEQLQKELQLTDHLIGNLMTDFKRTYRSNGYVKL